MNRNNRKPLKNSVNTDETRKMRETQRLSVQKDKRFAQCSLHRRKLEDTDEPPPKPAEVAEFPHYCAVLMNRNSSADDIRFCALYFRYLLSSPNAPPIEQVASSGLIPRFVELLQSNDPKTVYEVLWSLTNIACEGAVYAECMMQHGITAHLLRYVKAPQYDIMEQCIWLISHLTIHTTAMVDTLVANGVIFAVLEKLGVVEEKCHIIPSFVLMQCVAWILANVVRLHAAGDAVLYRNIVKALAIFLQAPDEDVIISICVGITCVAEMTVDLSHLLFEYSIPNRLHDLLSLKSSENKCHRHLLVALSSIVNSSNRWQQRILLRYNTLKYLAAGAGNLATDANQQQSNTMILTSCQIYSNLDDMSRQFCVSMELDITCSHIINSGLHHSSVVCVAVEILCVLVPALSHDRRIVALRALRQCININDMNCVLSILQCIISTLQALRNPSRSEFNEALLREILSDENFLAQVDSLSCSTQLAEITEAAEIIVYLCNNLSGMMDDT